MKSVKEQKHCNALYDFKKKKKIKYNKPLKGFLKSLQKAEIFSLAFLARLAA